MRPHEYEVDPLRYVDVYMDDILGLAQGNMLPMTRAILHSIDKVFWPLEDGDLPYRQETTLIKKLNKGDGHPTTHKTMLGWDINFTAYTMELTPRQRAWLAEILANYPRSCKHTSVSEWHKVLGELCSMALALPGS